MIMKAILLMCIMGYTAADDVGQLLNCQFNTGEIFCRWKDDPRDQTAVWESMNYGPEIGDAAFMSPVEGGTVQKHSARLWSSWLRFNQIVKPAIQCLKFVYVIKSGYKKQKFNASLALLKHSKGSCKSVINKDTGLPAVLCESKPLWKSITNYLPGWNTINVNLHYEANSTDFKLILEGTIPSGNPNAKICVDNITSSADPCPVPVPENLANPRSFHSWVELFGMTFAGALALGLTIPIAVFVVCLFERKRRRGKKNMRIIRHADELDLPEGINTNTCEDTNPLPQRYANSQVGVGHPRLMNRAMSTPAGTNGQGGNYTMGKRNGTPQQTLGPRSNSGQMSHTMGRGGMEGGWMMSSQHGDLMENDEYTIDSDYTTHRQMSVPANGYIPVASQSDTGMMQGQVASMNALQQLPGQTVMFQNRQIPQPQSNVIAPTSASNNPFGAPTNVGITGTGQDNRSLAGSHAVNFSTDENRATPGLPFYPPRYEEAMGFNHGQHVPMEEKPPLLPPRVPESSGSGAGTSCSTPLPPAPPPLPISGHPSAGRFNVQLGNEQ